MKLTIEPWDEIWTNELNAGRGKSPPHFAIYVMQCNYKGKLKDPKKNSRRTYPGRKIYRVGGIGVSRTHGSPGGNNAKLRLSQCKTVHLTPENPMTYEMPSRPWKYFYGATIDGDIAAESLLFATAAAESLLQYHFSRKFMYLGKSQFYCHSRKMVEKVVDNAVVEIRRNIGRLFLEPF